MSATKVKTSVSISREVLDAIDGLVGDTGQRSALVEQAVIEYIARHRRQKRGEQDRRLIDRHAEDLERDVEESLDFQAPR